MYGNPDSLLRGSHHGQAKWKIAPNLGALFEIPEAVAAFLPDYHYWLCDLTQYSDEDIKGEVSLRVAFLLFKYILREDLSQHLAEILILLRELTAQRTGLEYLETVLRYLSGGTDKITEETLQKVVEEVFPEGGKLMATIAEKWLEQGMEQGLEQGLQQGMQQGLLTGLELGLELKFGREGLQLLPEIRKLEDVDLLQTIHQRLKAANSVDDLRRIYE